MKQRIAIIICLLYMLMGGKITAQDNCRISISEEKLAYKHGEELIYAANYTWGPIWTDVGEVVLTTHRIAGTPVRYHVRGDGRTYKFYDTFFKVRDVYESSFEVPSLRPVHFYRDVHEGDYTMKNTFRFNWAKNEIHATIQRKTAPARDTIVKVSPCTFDIVTFFYYARNLNFTNVQPGQVFPIVVALDDDVFTLRYKFIKREKKKVKSIGTVNCLKFSVGVIAGEVFKGDESIELWISDDENHIPIMLESPIIVGKVKGRLKSYKNLKYPLNMAK